MISVLPHLDKLKGIALDLLFPQRCVGCGREGRLLCYSCQQAMPRLMPPLCPKCGQPQPSGTLCHSCVNWQSAVDAIRSPFRFDGVIRQAVHQLKYQNLRTLAVPLARLLHDYLAANPVPGEVLIPVPLHRRRLRERGYNQSRLLARELGKLGSLPVIADCLVRQRPTAPQTRTSTVDERQSNVAEAFACQGRRLQDKQVVLIDDVATTGATLDACAAALKAAGAISVWGLVLAREI